MAETDNKTFREINVEKLPSIPHTLINLINAFQEQDVDFGQISDILQKDPSLMTKIIQVANSAAYAQCSFKDFERMLVVLGMDSVKNISTTAAVQQFFSQFNSDHSGLLSRFWLQSLHAAYFAKALAKLLAYPFPDEAYLGGLLHKIGQLIFLSQYFDDYAPLLEQSKSEQDLKNQEQQLFGWSSAQTGFSLLNTWPTDSLLADAILYQDENIDQLFDASHLIGIVNLARRFAICVNDRDTDKKDFYQQVYQLYGLTEGVIENLVNEIREQIQLGAESLGIELDADMQGISNSEQSSLQLAAQVKDIALSAGTQSSEDLTSREQIIAHIMQNIHIVFGLAKSLYFNYEPETGELICSAENVQSPLDLSGFVIKTNGDDDKPVVRSLLNKSFNNRAIASSFEATNRRLLSIIDQQIIRILKSDGILCIPLFNQKTFFGILIAGVSHQHYPELLQQRSLIAEFIRTASRRLSQIESFQRQQQSAIEQMNHEQSLHIRKLIHEANNPLAIINNYLQILSMKMQNNEDTSLLSQLDTLQDEVRRVGDILVQMKEPIDYNTLIEGNTNINDLLKELISVFKASLFQVNNVMESVHLDDRIPSIQCDRDSLKQVFINLIKNAAEAMVDGGILEIESQDAINMDGQQFIQISIADTGPGMSEEVLANLFKPVKSTKGDKHSGLGLSISKTMIDKLGGQISCHNRGNGGVKFVILLPRKIAEKVPDNATEREPA